MSAKILVLDIETSPNLAYVWGLFNQNIALNQLNETSEVICFAARWHGSKAIEYHAEYDFGTQAMTGKADMVGAAHELVDASDAIVTWNGAGFDMPHLHREFILAGFTPPSPYKNIDLYQNAKRRFRFASNKLDHVAGQLGVGNKASTGGFDLWRRCMAGDDRAWRRMRLYNKRDVVVTDDVYGKLKPWLNGHPHLGLYDALPGKNVCGRCGSDKLQKRGLAATAVSLYQQYQCQGCGGWSRVAKREVGVDVRPVSA